jgi:hypothetical protein
MISYTARAAKALGFLKQYYNDIEVFVEDTANPAMWRRLLERVLPPNTKVKSVNLMGGRQNVTNACKMDQADDGRRKIYIVDADFDYVANRRSPRLKYFYRIKAYCIENILLHPHCVSELCIDCSPQMSRQDVYRTIDFHQMIGVHEELLRSLFLVYATSQELDSGIRTVAYSAYRLMSKVTGTWHFDPNKLKARIRQIVRESIQVVGVGPFRQKRLALSERVKSLPLDQVVSGKDYMMPAIFEQLSYRFGYRGNLEQFKVQLAKEFKPEFEPGLSRRLLKLVG